MEGIARLPLPANPQSDNEVLPMEGWLVAVGVRYLPSLERLHRKGLVTRWKVSHAYRYQPTLNRENFVVRQMVDGAGGMHSLASRGLLASFLDLVAEADDAALDELEELIARKRKVGQT